jgi:hypothetical protein
MKKMDKQISEVMKLLAKKSVEARRKKYGSMSKLMSEVRRKGIARLSPSREDHPIDERVVKE